MVPSATDSSRKISGAAEMIHLTVLMVQALQPFAPIWLVIPGDA
jgi:hypothetical protein